MIGVEPLQYELVWIVTDVFAKNVIGKSTKLTDITFIFIPINLFISLTEINNKHQKTSLQA